MNKSSPLRAELCAISANRFNVHSLAAIAVKADIVLGTQPVEGEIL